MKRIIGSSSSERGKTKMESQANPGTNWRAISVASPRTETLGKARRLGSSRIAGLLDRGTNFAGSKY